MWLEAIRKPTCDEARCPTCGGAVQRRTHGEVYAGAQILDGQRVEIRRVVAEGYADPIVLDAITQYFDGGLYRLWAGEHYYTRGGKSIHRAAWSQAFGPIPAGCHIHHRDSDEANNAIANLECLPSREHLSRTWHETKDTRANRFTDEARAAAAAWHGSEAGRLWHSRNARRSKNWTKWKREPRACIGCGKTFDCLVRSQARPQKYCSANCKAAAYRRRRRAE